MVVELVQRPVHVSDRMSQQRSAAQPIISYADRNPGQPKKPDYIGKPGTYVDGDIILD